MWPSSSGCAGERASCGWPMTHHPDPPGGSSVPRYCQRCRVDRHPNKVIHEQEGNLPPKQTQPCSIRLQRHQATEDRGRWGSERRCRAFEESWLAPAHKHDGHPPPPSLAGRAVVFADSTTLFSVRSNGPNTEGMLNVTIGTVQQSQGNLGRVLSMTRSRRRLMCGCVGKGITLRDPRMISFVMSCPVEA